MKPENYFVLAVCISLALIGSFYPEAPNLVTKIVVPVFYFIPLVGMLAFFHGKKHVWKNVILALSSALLPLIEVLWAMQVLGYSFAQLQQLYAEAGSILMFGPIHWPKLITMVLILPATTFAVATFCITPKRNKGVGKTKFATN